MNNDNNDEILKNILEIRVPPIFWDLIGYSGGLFILIFNNFNITIVFFLFFSLYGFLNMIFDIFTVICNLNELKLPNYNDCSNKNYFYQWFVFNKKYILKTGTQYSGDPFKGSYQIDTSHISVDVHLYIGKSIYLEKLLYSIYFFGITKKNYTRYYSINNKPKPTVNYDIFV